MNNLLKHMFFVYLAQVVRAAHDLTVKVAPRSKECFFVPVEAGQTLHVSYEVIDGGLGDPDIDFMARRSSDRNFAIVDPRSTSQGHDLQIHETGEVELCFDNGFSAITPKTVWFTTSLDESGSYERFDKDPSFRGVLDGGDDFDVSMSMEELKMAIFSIHGHLSRVREHQEYIRMQEAKDRNVAESNYSRVNLWSMWQLFVMIVVSCVQVIMIRSLFDEKSSLHQLWKRLC